MAAFDVHADAHTGVTLPQLSRIFAILTALCIVGGVLIAGIILPVALTIGAASNAATSSFKEIPTDLGYTEPSQPSVLLASDGTELARFYAENRVVVAGGDISQHMKNAVVAIEDRRFYVHNGIDVRGLLGAFVTNISGDSVAGGSSITQQYVKNALVERGLLLGDDDLIQQATERSMSRKVNEARYAISIEKTMTKEEILTGYLNLVQFGPSVYGVEAASQHYYSKSSKDLTIVEAALLAGITQSPARWDPERHPDDAQKRRDNVLSDMYRDGYITQEELDEALAIPVNSMLKISTPPENGCDAAGISSYFCGYVVKDVLRDESLGKTSDERVAKLYRGGLKIYTTLDMKKQKAAYDTLIHSIPVNDSSGIQTALASLEPATGKILAMAQNTEYGTPTDVTPKATKVNLNVSTDMGGGGGFQTGSVFKIFTLVEWLKQGHTISERVDGSPGTIGSSQWNISCSPGSATKWSFTNSEYRSWGVQTVKNATKYSINGSYARMAQKLDICNIAETAKAMGAKTGHSGDWDVHPPMVLGTNTLTPLSMAETSATLANDGVHCSPISYVKIEDIDGKTLGTHESTCERVIEEKVASQATEALKTVTVGDGSGVNAAVPGQTIAGKTGTTNNSWHTWFTGYDVKTSDEKSKAATAVWVGHMDGNKAMQKVKINGKYWATVHGGDIAATEFSTYTKAALANTNIAAENAQAESEKNDDSSSNAGTSANSKNTTNAKNSTNSSTVNNSTNQKSDTANNKGTATNSNNSDASRRGGGNSKNDSRNKTYNNSDSSQQSKQSKSNSSTTKKD
ncbi:MAG: transglycosylase domain-containing protein [Actinomycetaceae bacterium]|nr:transglycosylase domain-containing protein [Actinomycetaceae bacterium]